MDTKFSVVVLIISFCVFLTSHKVPPIVLKFFGGGGGVSGRGGGMTWFSKLPENLDFMHLDPGPRPKKHK